MLQTLERTNIFDARVLTAAHADALRALAGPGGLPLTRCPQVCAPQATGPTDRVRC